MSEKGLLRDSLLGPLLRMRGRVGFLTTASLDRLLAGASLLPPAGQSDIRLPSHPPAYDCRTDHQHTTSKPPLAQDCQAPASTRLLCQTCYEEVTKLEGGLLARRTGEYQAALAEMGCNGGTACAGGSRPWLSWPPRPSPAWWRAPQHSSCRPWGGPAEWGS